MYYIIYQTKNKINDKIYIGAHACDRLDDDYLGSGRYIRRAINKYGKENFERTTLHILNTLEEMWNKEREIVTEDFCKRKDTYNWRVGGLGNPKGLKLTEEWKQKLANWGPKNGMYGRHHTDASRQKMSLSKRGSTPWNVGIKHSEISKQKMSISSIGKLHSEETKAKMRISRLGKSRGPYKKKI